MGLVGVWIAGGMTDMRCGMNSLTRSLFQNRGTNQTGAFNHATRRDEPLLAGNNAAVDAGRPSIELRFGTIVDVRGRKPIL